MKDVKMVKRLRAEYINDKKHMAHAYKIREEVFVIEQQVAREDEYDQFEEESFHFLAWDGEHPCGTARWRFTNKGIKLERFAVHKSHRGQGVGSILVKTVLDHIAKHPEAAHKQLYLNAQLSALPLYYKFGFKPEGEHFMECNIEHQKMVR